MKKYFSIIRVFIITLVVFLTGCVHDDEYASPDLNNNQCANDSYFTDPKNEFVKWSLLDLKNKAQNQPFTENAYVEGYVASSDESGNIYKYLYVQDSPSNPSQGLVVSANAVSLYTRYPQGYKVYIKLKGLAMGTYGGIKQLGYYGLNPTNNLIEFGRIPEKLVFSSVVRSCTEKASMVPKEMTLTQIRNAADQNQYLGCLIKVSNAEFDAKVLCSIYAPDNSSSPVDRAINDATYTNPTTATMVVRNSGFASFASQTLPSGKGDFIGILSKYNSTYQFYINKASDLSGMKNFPRKDGITADPCSFDTTTATLKSIADVKKLFTGSNVLISDNIYVKAKITANDETNNIYRFVYIEDGTGGIRVNINKARTIYQDSRFKVGKTLIVKLKDLYVGKYNGEFQIGTLNGSSLGFIAEADVYKYLFDSNEGISTVTPTEIKISDITPDDVGKWVKIKNVQFADSELGNTYSGNRTLVDCSGNKIIVRTNTQASFANAMLDSGKGDIYAVVSVFNGTYQLIVPFQYNADFEAQRCDGTLPIYENIYSDGFTNLANWSTVNVLGTQTWATTTYGNPAPSAYFDGNRSPNEDWLISKKWAIPGNGYQKVYFSFETDGNYQGNPLEVYVTDNYTGDVNTTNWTKANANLDTDLAGFNGFVNSGLVDVSAFKGKDLIVAFKYTSVQGASTRWEIDNFSVKGLK